MSILTVRSVKGTELTETEHDNNHKAATLRIENRAELITKAGDFDNQTVNLAGYYTQGDGGGQLLYWDATSTETANDGTIFQVTGVVTGRWKSVSPYSISPYQFGVVGDGVTDDYTAAKAAIDYCIANKLSIHFTANTYLFNTQVRLDGPVTITGDGRGEDSASANPATGATIFKVGAAAGGFLIKSQTVGNQVYGVSIKDCVIDGNNTGAIGLHGQTCTSCVFDNLLIMRCTGAGIKLDDGNETLAVYNKINNYYYNATANAASANSIGIQFASVGSGWLGVVQTIMDNITTNTKDGNGITLSGCDNNIIYKHQGFIQAGGTGYALEFANGGFLHGRNNLVVYLTGKLNAQSSTYGNRIMHSPSESMVVTVASGGQLHYETHDYVNGDLHKTHSYRMDDKQWISATAMRADGTVALEAIQASQWACINYPAASTGSSYGNVINQYDWNDGEITGLTLTFSTDTANTTADVRLRVTMSALATADATATPNKDESFTVAVNDTANRINTATVSFAAALSYVNADSVVFRISRVGGDAADTALGNFQLLGVNVLYSGTGPNSGGSGPYDIPPPFV